MSKRVKLSDVAAGAGVSVATASAVLSGKEGRSIRVSDERRKKILDTASRLGYVPNTAAQHLKRGDDNHIIAVFTYENIFPLDPKSEYYLFFAGIQQEAEKEGYDILILNNWAKDKSRSSRIRLASGAIMIGVSRDDEHITSLVKQDFPLVFVGRRRIGDGLPVHCVTFDYRPSVEKIASILAHSGKREIVYVSSTHSLAEPSRDKSLFLHKYCTRENVKLSDVVIDDSISDEDIDTIIASGSVIFDRLFLADLFEPLLRKRGYVIGKDIKGAIFEDDWQESHKNWTRWENRRLELGAMAARHLISMLTGKDEDSAASVSIPVIESNSSDI